MDPGDAGKSRASSSSSAQQAQAQAAAAAAAAALGLLDPSALFAHSLFAAGVPASYNPMTPMSGYGLMGQGVHFSQASSASQANAQAQAAWWSMASQMAAQDYLTRLQHAAVSASGIASSSSTSSVSGRNGASSAASPAGFSLGAFPGLGAADSLLAGYASGASGSKSSGKTRTSSANPVVRDSLGSSGATAPSTSRSRPASSASTPAAEKFAAPEAAQPTGRKNGSSSKSRKRSATAQDAAASAAGTAASPASSLSSLSSMAMSYPFFSNPLASLSLPAGILAPAAQSSPADDKRKSSKKATERHSVDSQARLSTSSATTSSTSTVTTASVTTNNNNSINNNNNNNTSSSSSSTKARSQTVNGKPLALDVSSLIGKPSSSSSASSCGTSEAEAPLNLSMKTSSSKETDGQTASSSSSSSGSQSRLGRGVSMPKKNTVASLLAQSRNQRSNSPAGSASQAPAAHAASNPSASELKAMKDNLALYTAMQELSNPKYSNALLNGIKDSLNPGQSDANHAIQDLLRAASLLGGLGLPAGTLAGLGGLSAQASKSSTAPANSKASEGKSSLAGDSSAASTPSKTNEKHSDREDKTPTPSKAENGKSTSGNNGKTSHDHDAQLSDDSDSMDEDDSMMDTDDEDGGDGSRKRSAHGGDGDGDGDGEGDQPSKKRRCVSNEAALRVPLSLGWKRETLIRSIGKSGVRGEVTYYSPSGRRFRQYPDVVRYLERQGIGNLTRDNFSFSTRCIVGEFVQPLGESGNSRGIRLGEPEVRHLVDQIRIARGWKPRSRRMTDEEKEAMNREKEAQRVAQRLEAQELARQAQEAKLQQRMERERALQEAKEARRIAREQEKLERQEAQRRERELRTQQLMEARKKRQEELDRLREEEQQRKIQELNKQRELFYTAELERERKRQHTAIVKALEARKRYEDRERRREELRAEKRAEREKKLEERRREQESWRDQRSPAEDMSLADHKVMPKVPRIENLRLSGKAFADVLMLYEFLNTFGETLGFDMDSLPSLDSLQKALLYDSEAEEELLSVMTHLLVCAIEDPGIPHPNRHTTLLGQTLKQADITTTNVSEILRIYLQANGLGDIKLSDRTCSPSKATINPADCSDSEAFAMSEWLKRKPFLSLNPTQKAAVLGFLVNELLQNKAVIGQIDSAIEGQNTARRDRWIVDSKIKKLKTLHSKKSRHSASVPSHAHIKHEHPEDGTGHDETNQSAASGAPSSAKKAKTEEAPDEDHADDADDDSGAEADEAAEQDDEDESLPADELKKKVERLSRQSNQMLTQLALSDLQLRALNMGQDRFRRRMWILPHAGGVYLEAIESGEANAGALGTWDGKPTPPIAPPCSDDEASQEAAVPDVKQEEAEANEQVSNVQVQTDNKENIKTELPTVEQEQSEEHVEKEQDVKTESEPEVVEALPALWFSLFPRNPCDARSITRTSNGALEAESTHGDVEGSCIKTEDAVKEEAEKVDMQPIPEAMSRGWWRIVDPEQVKVFVEALHPRGVREKELSRMLTRFMDFAKDSCLKGKPRDLLLKEVKNTDQVEMLGGAPLPDPDGSWSRETSMRGDMLLLEQIESLEDRIAAASMQVKGWKPPARITADPNIEFRTSGETPPESETEEQDDEADDDEDDEDERPLRKSFMLGKGPINPIQVAKDRLLNVELAIERRYLKAPLGHCKGDIVQSVLSGTAPPSEPPKALLTWRDAVKKCETAAQVSMCFYVLETSVAWDKSIMKASCQFCHNGDKEDQLLLCDGCDKGYHTYCFRPPMDNIPDGDWFCFECRNKATGQRNCIVCGKPGNKSNCVLCDQCPKAFHIECHTPVLPKVPRGKWLCSVCHVKSPAKKKPAAKKTSSRDRVSESETASVIEEASSSSVLNDATPPASVSSAAPSPRRSTSTAAKRKDSQASAKDKDLAPCRTILDQLEAHEEAWPFLLPVNTKQFPTYKKIIRSPMDLSTIRKKLNDGVYKTRDEFCADLQLMFVNCVTFNEDDSPVGKAGHSMKTFFDTRWAELIAH